MQCRFEFPQQLNMYKYTVEGLAEAEQTEPLQAPSPVSDTNVQYEYELKGVVVHAGTAFAGHYYSYIKVGLTKVSSFTSAAIASCQEQSGINSSLHACVFHARMELLVMLYKSLK